MEGEKNRAGEAGGQQGKECVLLQGGDQVLGFTRPLSFPLMDSSLSLLRLEGWEVKDGTQATQKGAALQKSFLHCLLQLLGVQGGQGVPGGAEVALLILSSLGEISRMCSEPVLGGCEGDMPELGVLVQGVGAPRAEPPATANLWLLET